MSSLQKSTIRTYSRRNLETVVFENSVKVESCAKRKITDWFPRAISSIDTRVESPIPCIDGEFDSVSFVNNVYKSKLLENTENVVEDIGSIVKVPATAKSKSRQMYLDFGQGNLTSIQCGECGVLYDSSFSSDVRLHAQQHRLWMQRWSSVADKVSMYCEWRRKFADGFSILSTLKPCAFLKQFLDYVCDDMSASHLKDSIFLSSLLVNPDGTVVSVVVANYNNASSAIISVERVWTAKEYRQRGLAKRLMLNGGLRSRDCIRVHSDWAQCNSQCILAIDSISFTQPTFYGRLLAASINCTLFT